MDLVTCPVTLSPSKLRMVFLANYSSTDLELALVLGLVRYSPPGPWAAHRAVTVALHLGRCTARSLNVV
jgi:hypothetical protein